MTYLQIAEEVLRQVQKPLSYTELWDNAVALGIVIKGKKDNINLSAALTTEIKNKPNSIFVKTGEKPILYGLKEWGNEPAYLPKENIESGVPKSTNVAPIIPNSNGVEPVTSNPDDFDPDDGNNYTTDIQIFDPIKQDIDVNVFHWSVFDHIRKINNGQIILEGEDMGFQRKTVWKIEAKSRFIESILMGFPLPPLYLNARGNDGAYIIIDGLQRTSTLKEFLGNEFELKGLKGLQHLNDHKFSDTTWREGKFLPKALRAKIEDKTVDIHVLKQNTPLRLVYELFDRLNTGGTPLSRQEVRNGIFVGKSTILLKNLSEEQYFKDAINNAISAERMKDREIVLRYLAFRNIGYEKYHTDLSPFLEDTMRFLNKMAAVDIANWSKDFERTMKWSLKIFDKQNFRIPNKNGQNGMLNVAVLESVACALAVCDDTFLEKNQLIIKNNYNTLVQNEHYLDAVKAQTSNKQKVIQRFELAKQILLNLKND